MEKVQVLMVNLPFIKPFCVSLIINGNRGLILLAITAEAILSQYLINITEVNDKWKKSRF
jgi:hypothetical protein